MLDSVSEKSALAKAQHRIVLHKQAVALTRFDTTAALLLNSLMSKPAEPGVTPELRMREVSALLRSAKFAEPRYILDAALTALCGQELDSSMKTDWFKQQIVELQVKNGWVKQF